MRGSTTETSETINIQRLLRLSSACRLGWVATNLEIALATDRQRIPHPLIPFIVSYSFDHPVVFPAGTGERVLSGESGSVDVIRSFSFGPSRFYSCLHAAHSDACLAASLLDGSARFGPAGWLAGLRASERASKRGW